MVVGAAAIAVISSVVNLVLLPERVGTRTYVGVVTTGSALLSVATMSASIMLPPPVILSWVSLPVTAATVPATVISSSPLLKSVMISASPVAAPVASRLKQSAPDLP